MKINWIVEKQRGNFRPMLKYNISLEEHEEAIAMHAINIESLIPRVPEGNRAWCSPCCDEREEGWQPESFHYISVPHFKNGSSSGCCRLPFRELGEYPEVEESFKMLRTAYEKVVREVYRWKPKYEEGELNITTDTKEQIAATVTAQRMLSLFESSA